MENQPPVVPGEPPVPVPELRARGVGEIIDAAMKLYFARWKTFIPVAAVFMVPYAAVSAIAQTSMQSEFGPGGFLTDPEAIPTPQELFSVMAPFALLGLVALLLYPVLAGALSWAAARAYLGDNPPVGRIISFAFSRFGSLLLVSILTGLVLAGILIIPFIILAVLVAVSDAGFLFLFAFPVIIVLAIIVIVRLILAPTALVVENARGTDALKRSWNLVKGFFWKVVGTTLLAAIITFIVQVILTFPFSILAGFLIEDSPVLSAILAFIGGAIGGSLITPFGLIVQVVLYFDLRIRKEAFDLSLMAQQLEQ